LHRNMLRCSHLSLPKLSFSRPSATMAEREAVDCC
jgi:hypothetical protein